MLAIVAPVVGFHVQSVAQTWPEARRARQSLVAAPGGLFAAVRRLPSRDVVFASGPDAAWALGDKYSIALPATWSIWTSAPNAQRMREIHEIRRILCRRPGVIALSYFAPNGIVELRGLLRNAGFVVASRHTDGVIMRSDPARCRRSTS